MHQRGGCRPSLELDETGLFRGQTLRQHPHKHTQRTAARVGRLRSALALGAVLNACIVLAATRSTLVDAQPVALSKTGDAQGCLQQAPSPPTHVQADVQNGAVVLSWSPPVDGSCVSTYIVDAFNASQRSTIPIQSVSTDQLNVTLVGLTNGAAYTFRVQAYSPYNGGGAGVANVTASPSARCSLLAPGPPTSVVVKPGQGMATLCWGGPANHACVDSYSVSAVPTSQANFKAALGSQSISQGGCANISSLQDSVQYTFSVVAVSNAYGQSSPATSQAYVGAHSASQNQFTCKMAPGCRPNTLSECSLLGCAGTYSMGGCRGPGMYDINWASRQVLQWCASSCPCDTTVASVYNPISWGVASGLMAGLNALVTPASTVAALQTPLLSAATGTPGLPSLGALLNLATPAPSGGSTRTVGTGAIVTNLLQNTASSGVVGNTLGQTVGNVAGDVTAAVVNSAFQGIVGAITQG